MNQHTPIDHHLLMPDVFQGLAGVQELVAGKGLDAGVYHLVRLRASQINGCAYCVKMHTREARAHGESNERLDRLVVWEHVPDFTEQEKAALAWTEALTRLERGADLAGLRARLRRHFEDGQISALTLTIAMINLWNRIAISSH